MIEVVVGDDHPVVREGIVRLLSASPGIVVVGEAADGAEVVQLVRTLQPNVAVVDYRMPVLNGAEVADAVTREGIRTGILIISGHLQSAIAFDVTRHGASGVLSKEASREEIVAEVRDVAAGKKVLPPALAAEMIDRLRLYRNDNLDVVLSPREQEVITAMASGKTVRTMAKDLYLSPSTVRTHVQRLYEKLAVNDRGSAVAEAMRRGLLK